MINLCLASGGLFLVGSILYKLCTHTYVANVHNISTTLGALLAQAALLGFLIVGSDLRHVFGLSDITAGRLTIFLGLMHLILFWMLVIVTFQMRLYFSLLGNGIKLLPLVVIIGVLFSALIFTHDIISIFDTLLQISWVPFALLFCIELFNYLLVKNPDKVLHMVLNKIIRSMSMKTSSDKLSIFALSLVPDGGMSASSKAPKKVSITSEAPKVMQTEHSANHGHNHNHNHNYDSLKSASTVGSSAHHDTKNGKDHKASKDTKQDIKRKNTVTKNTHLKLKRSILSDASAYWEYGVMSSMRREPSMRSKQQLDEAIDFHAPISRPPFAVLIKSIKNHHFTESPPINFLPHIEPTIFYLVNTSILFLIMLGLCLCYKYIFRGPSLKLFSNLVRPMVADESISPTALTAQAYVGILEYVDRHRIYPTIHSIALLQLLMLMPVCNWRKADTVTVFSDPVIFQVFARWLELNKFGAPLAFLIDCYLYRQRPTYEAVTVNKIYTKWVDMITSGIIPCTNGALAEVEFLIAQVMSAGMKKNHFNDMVEYDSMLDILDGIGVVTGEKQGSRTYSHRTALSSKSVRSLGNSFNQQLYRSLSTDFVINMDVFAAIEVELSILMYICAIKFLCSITPVYFKVLTYLSTLEHSSILPNTLFRIDSMDARTRATSESIGKILPSTSDTAISNQDQDQSSHYISSKNYCNVYIKNMFKSLSDSYTEDLKVELAILAVLNNSNPNIVFGAVSPRAIIRLSSANKRGLFMDQLTLLSDISAYNMSHDLKSLNIIPITMSQNLILKNLAHTRARKNSLIGTKPGAVTMYSATSSYNEGTTAHFLLGNEKLFSYFDSTEEKLVKLLREIMRSGRLSDSLYKKAMSICQLLDPRAQITPMKNVPNTPSIDSAQESEDWNRLFSEIRNMKPFNLMGAPMDNDNNTEFHKQLQALDEGKYILERDRSFGSSSKLSYNIAATTAKKSVEDMFQLFSNKYPKYTRMPNVSQREFRVNNTTYHLNSAGELILTLQQRILKAVLNITVVRVLEYFETESEESISLTVTPELAEKYNLDCSDINLAVEYNVDKISSYICQNIESVGFDVKYINKYTRNYGFTAIGYILAKALGITSYFNIHDNVLLATLIELESYYTPTLYHNKLHAADVAQMCMYLISNIYCSLHDERPKHPFYFVFRKMHSYWDTDYYSLLQNRPKHAVIRPIDFLSLLFGGLCHDLGHTGIDNLFCINTENALALLYNDEAPLEHAHASLSWSILTQMTIYFKHFTSEQYKEFRTLFLEIILATDMSTHFGFLRRLESISADLIKEILARHKETEIALLRWYVLKICIKFGDLSNPCRPIEISTRYAVALMNEFWSLGDLMLECGLEPDKIKIRPLKGEEPLIMANAQIGFSQNIVVDFLKAVEEFCVALADVKLTVLQDNLTKTIEYWKLTRAESEDGRKEQ